MATCLFEIKQINHKNSILKLKSPFVVKYYMKDGHYFYDNEELDIYDNAQSLDELKKAIEESLITLFDIYVDCDINILSESAKKLRCILKDMVLTEV